MVHSFQSNQGIKRQPYYIEIMQLLSDPSLFHMAAINYE